MRTRRKGARDCGANVDLIIRFVMKSSPRARHRKARPRAVVRPRLFGGRAARRVSATEAARTFSDLLNRVQYRGDTVVVERGGVPVCEMSPAKPLSFTLAELVTLLRSGPRPDAAYWDELEQVTRRQPVVEPSSWER